MQPLTDTDLATRSGSDPGPAARAEADDDLAATRRSIDDLPDNQREVVRLKFLQELSYKEIAAVTGLGAGHVGYLLHTALNTLREELH